MILETPDSDKRKEEGMIYIVNLGNISLLCGYLGEEGKGEGKGKEKRRV